MAKKKQKAKKQVAKKKPSTTKKQVAKKKPAPKNSTKKKAPKKQAPKKGGKKAAAATLTPDICVTSFSAKNGDTVIFQNFPVISVTVSQISGNDFPFTPVTGQNGGLKYSTIVSGDSLTVTVPTVNKNYPYAVSCPCSILSGNHSVTVGN
jgi:hypothetical protein